VNLSMPSFILSHPGCSRIMSLLLFMAEVHRKKDVRGANNR
jgi:hypothetical protein